MTITALAQWFGGNRMLGEHVGKLLDGCKWVGVPFAGGMGELLHIKARTMLVNDLHRHVINLARVVADDALRPELVRRLNAKGVHPDELAGAQAWCAERELLPPAPHAARDLEWAENYFVCSWMGRGGNGGARDEFTGRVATRWNATGGDSAVRYFNAVEGLEAFSRTLKRCTFEVKDAFEFIARCFDGDDYGIYEDPPFPVAGRKYRFHCGKTEKEERDWHTRLRDTNLRFTKTRVVMRFYDHPLIRELYPETRWHWNLLEGRKQSNEAAPEVLLVNQRDGLLF
jgi:site-specific DNA-adenine methylase